MDLVWSDDLVEEARAARDDVAAELGAHGIPGEVAVTGAAGVPGALTKGDLDLHLRVPADRFGEAVRLLRALYPVGSPGAWASTLAVFDVPRPRATGLAVTPVGSEHDVRFVSTWREVARRPELLAEYNEIKRTSWGTPEYEERKSAFFTAVSDAHNIRRNF